jgi:hypothetical protein
MTNITVRRRLSSPLDVGQPSSQGTQFGPIDFGARTSAARERHTCFLLPPFMGARTLRQSDTGFPDKSSSSFKAAVHSVLTRPVSLKPSRAHASNPTG